MLKNRSGLSLTPQKIHMWLILFKLYIDFGLQQLIKDKIYFSKVKRLHVHAMI